MGEIEKGSVLSFAQKKATGKLAEQESVCDELLTLAIECLFVYPLALRRGLGKQAGDALSVGYQLVVMSNGVLSGRAESRPERSVGIQPDPTEYIPWMGEAVESVSPLIA